MKAKFYTSCNVFGGDKNWAIKKIQIFKPRVFSGQLISFRTQIRDRRQYILNQIL